MPDIKLRNHIPLSAPATREPCTGDEPFLRVSLGFVPRWFSRRLGIDFSERWHTDPVYRYKTLLAMKTLLHEAFPTVPYFKPVMNEKGVEPSCATVSGVHGIRLIPMVYGMGTRYFADGWPDAASKAPLTKEHLARLEPLDVMQAIRMLIRQVNEGRAEVENEFSRAVDRDGNLKAQQLVAEVFELRKQFEWRGLNVLPYSALRIRSQFAEFDAEQRFSLAYTPVPDHKACDCGAILRGIRRPQDCKLFGTVCTPENPIGSCIRYPR